MEIKEYMAKYGVSEKIIKRLTVWRLNAMSEDARAVLIGMSARDSKRCTALLAKRRRRAAQAGSERVA